jgi:hypothetical protein
LAAAIDWIESEQALTTSSSARPAWTDNDRCRTLAKPSQLVRVFDSVSPQQLASEFMDGLDGIDDQDTVSAIAQILHCISVYPQPAFCSLASGSSNSEHAIGA